MKTTTRQVLKRLPLKIVISAVVFLVVFTVMEAAREQRFTHQESQFIQRVAVLDSKQVTLSTPDVEILREGQLFCEILSQVSYQQAMAMDILGKSKEEELPIRLAAAEVLCPENVTLAG